ncbi:methyltransferase domain-containing protein [Komarekiella sp. 'clone 1']|uniref:Methyltransferase domain-containing protein n=1 Tax=Komarekiella delphini-convector SJRDD-AB1 TaxID=2593771 RepID=A0AA40SWF2_9NOST|nr:class I SAM-dependent methyltransferase [Komarekiella delphini-convector]MBD6616370.1 methyltransferase domain-containing protein [Komarekiella delphini-convector SJRDD-AB1]
MCTWNAKDYHKNSTNQQSWAQDLIANLKLNKNEIILDIGCGDGKITAFIANLVPNGLVIGIDSSKDMINFAQQNFPPSDFPNLTFQHKDARELDFKNEFDIIVSFACLHWITDHLPILEGIKRSLKPTSQAILQFGGKNHAAPINDATTKVIYNQKWSNYFQDFTFKTRFYSDDEYQDLLKRVGLKAKRVELVQKDMIFEGKEGLKGSIRTIGKSNFLWRIPENLHEEIIDEITDIYLENYPLDSENLAHVSMVILEVEATKMV